MRYVLVLAVALITCAWSRNAVIADDHQVVIWANEAYERFDNQPQNPAIYLQLVSTNSFPCSNYYYPTSITVVSGSIRVEVGEPVEPKICLTAIGPAKSRVMLPIGEGVFTLELVTWLGTDTYQLSILAARLDLAPISASVTSPSWTRVYRYPPDSFELSCSGPECFRVLEGLLDEHSLTEIMWPSDGLLPYRNQPDGWPMYRSFRYHGEAEWQAIKEWVSSYDDAGFVCALFSVTNWRSETFRSWVATSLTPTPTPTSNPSVCNLSATPAPTPSPTASPTGAAQVTTTPAALPFAGGPQSETDGSISRWILIAVAAGVVILITGAVRRRRA
jgi:hypothetical protein